MHKSHFPLLLSFPLLLATPAVIQAEAPYDFYEPAPVRLIEKVEKNHLPQAQREFNQGNYEYAWGELSFVLHYFPNHPQALKEVGKLSIEMGQSAKAVTFFERALSLYPQVSETSTLYAQFLIEAGLEDTVTRLLPLVESAESPNSLRYPLGLAYLEQGNIAKAKEQADILREHGYPFPTLKDKLAALGAW